MKTKFEGNILIIGLGSITQGTLPLLFRHFDISHKQVKIITADENRKEIAEKEFNVEVIVNPLTVNNYVEVLDKLVKKGDFIVNLSVDVSSKAVALYCLERDIFYTDTCTEYWAGGYTSKNKTTSERSNYWLRESFLELKGKGKTTCLMTHGANPGLVSHLTKKAMLNISKDISGKEIETPKTQKEWSSLARDLGIKVIHIAERDTQESKKLKKVGEFVNTWSVDGFISEGLQPSELGWGTHEKNLPKEGRHHSFGRQSAIYLERPGMNTRVRTWVPGYDQQIGFLITHAEAISISDYFSLKQNGKVIYRPTVHYAYHPCNDAVLSCLEFVGREFEEPKEKRILGIDETIAGEDALGVLLMGHEKNAYWFGSKLDIETVKSLVPYNTATSLQVTITVVAGMIWAINHPEEGVVEPDEVDYKEILDVCEPYLGDVVGVYSDWNPLKNRTHLFEEKMDDSDCWLFENFLLQ